MDKHIFSIGEISKNLKEVIEANTYFKNIYVKGEISNLVFNKSGHIYLSLKDEQSSLTAMIWKSNANKFVSLNLNEGMEIIAYGRITFYIPNAKVSFEITDISVEGVGDLQLLFDKRLQEIKALGWTDLSRKKPIPRFVQNIGIITADTGAAIKDLITTIKRRMPLINIYLFPSMVQGEFAKIDIAKKIKQANMFKVKLDILIVGRGGGSYEDLWCFNEMEVLKSVIDSTIPIISAVGHEPDITLIDYVSDLRAPTPTSAGELATPNQKELLKELSYIYHNQKQLIISHLNNDKNTLNILIKNNYSIIKNEINKEQKELNYFYQNTKNLIKNILDKNKILLENIKTKTQLLNPKKPLEKGYGLLIYDNQTINTVNKLKENDIIKIILNDGEISTQVKEVIKNGK
ncbi:exodeoxyribonuclease VII large subunit [Entomoplasma ellychniae]|uniref:Exodeoxyribonuclease 7 large subunit n=1 Tax=Entomoplasma ellychniae TaxID=2114 RepID=A0A8E2UDY8_9MOLU|nr:exodeoxyribonuclease VII large subunit [Entomoplasma ellychniae]PPE04563.1 exodeoxyribonuclease VII large subunit [Entomoplasma ellychniae]